MVKMIKRFFDRERKFALEVNQLYKSNCDTKLYRQILSFDDTSYEFSLITDYGRMKNKLQTGNIEHLKANYSLMNEKQLPFRMEK